MKIITKPLRNAARDAMIGSVIGVASFSLSMILIYGLLHLLGYDYNFALYIPQIVVVATIISVVGTTANAYRERKLKKKEQIQKIITENRSKWLAETRTIMADLYAAEKTFISNPAENKNLLQHIDTKVSQLVLNLPYDEDILCDEIYCLANDVKVVESGAETHLLCRIRVQEKKCRKILKEVWKDIKEEAKIEIDD